MRVDAIREGPVVAAKKETAKQQTSQPASQAVRHSVSQLVRQAVSQSVLLGELKALTEVFILIRKAG